MKLSRWKGKSTHNKGWECIGRRNLREGLRKGIERLGFGEGKGVETLGLVTRWNNCK